jgi:hypothetical protein
MTFNLDRGIFCALSPGKGTYLLRLCSKKTGCILKNKVLAGFCCVGLLQSCGSDIYDCVDLCEKLALAGVN